MEKKPKICCGAGILVINEMDEVLLVKRSDNAKWAVPGGGVEIGETVEQTAKRELFEETGLIANSIVLLDIYSGPETRYIYPDGNEVYWITLAYLSRDYSGDILTSTNEITDCCFFGMNRLPESIDKIDKLILADYEKQMNNPTRKEATKC